MKVLLFSERLDVKPEPSNGQVWCLFYLTKLLMYIAKTNGSNWGYLLASEGFKDPERF